MNTQYVAELNQESVNELTMNTNFFAPQPIYGGDRPSDCTQKNTYFCPSRKGPTDEWKCIKLEDLCDSHPDCPNYEDENPTICMFHVLLRNQLQIFAKIVKSALENKRGKE
uniref:Uncharacterized protein n=1 Tax=Parastrongyloides trichosuri TaxID=131310 RepID=A0A0N4ZW85_PARTI